MVLTPYKSGGAHEFWVEPDRFHVAVGDTIPIRLYQGQQLKGETLPYITDWFTRFEHVDATGQRRIESDMGNDPAAMLRIRSAGDHWLFYRSTRDFIKLDAEKFHQYLRDEGLERIIEQRRALGESEQPAREYYSRCAKSLLTAAGPASVGERDFGMTFELIPLENPGRIQPGQSLPLRVRYLDTVLPDALVVAFRRGDPASRVMARSNQRGEVVLRFQEPGIWLIKAVHMVRWESDGSADWESFWASLLFRIAPVTGEETRR